ncbi:MAG: hypothetical protein GY854_14590 [Deltaproteobacteria bacterium]|nr:hypothetical protein [Deltaproteobacteria bacterium]
MKTIFFILLLFSTVTVLGYQGCKSDEKKTKPATEASGSAGQSDPKPVPVRKPREKVSRKLLLLGIDGADWRLMDPLLDRGALPNFKRLVASGTRAPLKTIKPTASPLIWTTIATGVGPRKHGITDFAFKVPGKEDSLLPTSNMRRVKAIWNILSDQKTSVGVIGWWATYPAEEVVGFVVSDQASTLRNDNYRAALNLNKKTVPHLAQAETFPPELDQEIEKLIKASPDVGLQHLERFMKLPKEKLEALKAEKKVNIEDIFSVFSFALLIDQAFIVASLHGIEKYRPDFAAVYLAGLDHAAEHNFWKFIEPEKFDKVTITEDDIARYSEVINKYYIYMDEVLGRFLALYPENESTIIVVSDHGHEANKNYDPSSDDHYNRVCSGDHNNAPDGIVLLSGKDIRAGAQLKGASVGDIAPTVLALMGAPVGEDMPGRVLTEAIRPEFLEAHPVTTVKTHSAGRKYSDTPVPSAMGKALTDKLKGLGYIK